MSDAVHLPPISPVSPTPAARRVNSALGTTTVVKDPAGAKSETSQPVAPVAPTERATSLSITRDEAANTCVYRSIDKKTGEVVWQYPLEQVLRLAHRLRELENLDQQHKIDERI